ncbi:hypothetical protein Tco_0993460 [Tanacetum coccineum]
MFSERLKSRWSGPFTISHVFPYGTVELSQNSGPNFKVNGHRIKHYFGGDVPKLVVPYWVKLSDPKQALRGRHPMLILVDCPGFWKPLVLAVLSFDHKSFKLSASFGKSRGSIDLIVPAAVVFA